MLLDVQPERRKSTISLTPLIDVVFILLLFFMLSSSFITQRQIVMPIPDASTASNIAIRHVSVPEDNANITLGQQTFSIANMKALQNEIAQAPDAVYVLDLGNNVSTQTMISIMDGLYQAGAHNVTLSGVTP